MDEASSRKLNSRPIAVELLIILGATLVLFGVFNGLYWLISGKTIPGGVGIVFAWPAIGYFLSRPNPNSQVNAPELDGFHDELEGAGIRGARSIQIRIFDSEYPRPVVVSNVASIPKSLHRNVSKAALLWFLKVEIAAMRINRNVYWVVVLWCLMLIAVLAIFDRINQLSWGIASCSAFALLGFVAMYYFGLRAYYKADRCHTSTAADRAAAKEALGYAYFSQRDRPAWNRLLFMQSELRNRAFQLGIELERGYRADAELAGPTP